MATLLRRLTLSVTIAGTPLPFVLSAKCNFGFSQRVSQATFEVPNVLLGSNYDQEIVITMGAGTNNIVRFVGIVRTFQYTPTPRGVEYQCYGYLQLAAEYENWEDSFSTPIGGLSPLDLTGNQPDTASNIITAVLGKVGIPGPNIGAIDSTAILYGLYMDAFTWRNGRNSQNPNLLETGETALSYIERYDEIDAVFSGGNGGRYRTYERLGGITERFLVGGRPRNAIDFTFTETVDILDGQIQRSKLDFKNYFVVTGYDVGNGAGPFAFPVPGDPGFGGSGKRTYRFSSEMIERAHDADPGTGQSCEVLANAISLDYNREIVTGWIETFRDDAISLAQTHLVSAPGGAVDRLGTGEKLWVQALEVSIDGRGFTQRITYIGGGVDPTLAGPP